MRKHWVLASGVAVVASGLVAVLLGPQSDEPVSRARCERVQVGMTLEEVVAVLGGPTGDYRKGTMVVTAGKGGPNDSFMKSAELLSGERPFRYLDWQGDDGTFWVCFDTKHRVVACKLTPGRRVTFLDKLRAWLGF